MTFSDIVTVLGAGVGILLLLAVAAAPLLADLDPDPRRRARVPARGPHRGTEGAERAADAPRAVDVPAPRVPAAVETVARVSGHARHVAAG